MISVHDVTLTLEPTVQVAAATLEELTFDVECVLYDHACGEQFSAAVACSFEPPGIEIDLSIPAVSPALLNQRISEVLTEIQNRVAIELDLREQQVELHEGASASPAA